MHRNKPTSRLRPSSVFAASMVLAAVVPGCSGESSSSSSGAADTGGEDGGTSASSTTGGGTASASSTTSTSGSTTSADTGSTSSTFIQDPDGGVIGEECDVWTQDCPEGEKCMPWANDGGNAWNATKCSPVDPDAKQVGDTCTVEGNAVSGVDDCVKGAMCWNVDPETNMGTCIEMCTGSPDAAMCSDPSYECAIYNDGVLIICVPPCDPLLQDCADGEVCIPNTSGDGFNCILDASGGMGQAGTPCEFVNVCNPGLMCVGAESVPGCMGSQGCCTPFCDLTDGNANTMCANAFTSPGAECVPFFEMGMAPPGHEDVGVCAIPQ